MGNSGSSTLNSLNNLNENKIKNKNISLNKNKVRQIKSNIDIKYLEKRKRFRELVRINLISSISTQEQINKIYFEDRYCNITNINFDNNFIENLNKQTNKIKNNNSSLCMTNNNNNNLAEKSFNDDNKNSMLKLSNCNEVYSNNSYNKDTNIEDCNFKKTFENTSSYRNKYYIKLINNNYFVKLKNQTNCQNIFIFDWDDTIMCTTFITPNGYFSEKNLEEIKEKKDDELFYKLENLIKTMLNYSINQGDTYIITNAASGWVEFSAKLLFPNIISVLEKVTVISARNWFEKEYPGNSKMWKQDCFEEIGKLYSPYKLTNLIAIGDSLIELEAAYVLAKRFNQCFIKTIKLKDAPSPVKLLKQLELIVKDFSNIVKIQQSITIAVKKNTVKNRKSKLINNNNNRSNSTKNNVFVDKSIYNRRDEIDLPKTDISFVNKSKYNINNNA